VHISEILGHSAFDGMAAYSLLQAYDVTHDQKYMDAALPIVNYCRGLGGFNNTLNWGLMAAMGISKYYALTGDPGALRKTRAILASCRYWQHPDGSFPHYCTWTTDVHYSGWMGMELLHIRRYVDDPNIDPCCRASTRSSTAVSESMASRRTSEPCEPGPDCYDYFDSYRSGCTIDYDTRGWINELGYTAMVFDHFDTPKYTAVVNRLYSLGPQGVFPDKWDYFPAETDPIYPWGSADSSVIRTSVVFWSLASIYRTRYAQAPQLAAPADDAGAGIALASMPAPAYIVVPEGDTEPHARAPGGGCTSGSASTAWRSRASIRAACAPRRTIRRSPASASARTAPAHPQLRALTPNPTAHGAAIALSLARPAQVSVAIYDASGRRVRALATAPFAAGEPHLNWDGRDDAGRVAPSGIYFVRVRAGDTQLSGRLLVVH
jgi:hypothetical protein